MAASITSGDAMAGLKAASQEATIADLCAGLGNVEQLAGQISGLKAETLQKEAAILAEIIKRITPLVPILSKEYEAFYRREMVIITNRDEVQFPLEKASYFFSEHKLILYENGLLIRAHRFGAFSEGPRPGWELREEYELTPDAAIAAFGLAAIAEGLVKIFQEAHSTVILKEELEAKLRTLTTALEAISEVLPCAQ